MDDGAERGVHGLREETGSLARLLHERRNGLLKRRGQLFIGGRLGAGPADGLGLGVSEIALDGNELVSRGDEFGGWNRDAEIVVRDDEALVNFHVDGIQLGSGNTGGGKCGEGGIDIGR